MMTIPVAIHSFSIINWNLEDIRRMNRKKQKLLALCRIPHLKANVNRMFAARQEEWRGIINLERYFKTTTTSLNSYLELPEDQMLYVVLQHEKKKKLHSVVKESRKFKFQLDMTLEENEPNMTAIKTTQEIKQKAKEACQEDMKKTWREKPQHGR